MKPDFTCISYVPNLGWEQARLNIRATEGSSTNRVSVVMTGAGLGIAAMPGSPSWGELIRDVAKELNVPITGKDTRLDAMTVSWNASRRRATAQPSTFQTEVAECIKRAHKPDSYDTKLQCEVARFLTTVHCDVVIDLSYDRLVEGILSAAEIPYYRIIGAQLDIHAPLPEGTIVLWKVHGSVDHPATIVLSPTEYQRIYEVNDLGTELARLGSKAHTVWTVGVGLVDDDVWSYLTSQAQDLDIVSFWATPQDASRDAEETLGAWLSVLGDGVSHVTVLNAAFGKDPHALRQGLHDFIGKPAQVKRTRHKSVQLEATLETFDDRWRMAYLTGTPSAMSFVVDQFYQEYSDLVHFMLTRGKSKGHRWLPFLHADSFPSEAILCDEFNAILGNARDMVDKYKGKAGKGLLLENCAQTVVRYVFDWLESFKIGHEIVATRPSPTVIQRDSMLRVGANPFDPDVRSDKSSFNLNHMFTLAAPLKLGAPLVGTQVGVPVDSSIDLLTEDEWECAVRMSFAESEPRLDLGAHSIDLNWIPPIFPWGFGRNGLAAYRSRTAGTVTKAWHLVSNRDAAGRQICKGGSLRDRGERAFMLGRRGLIRIGEFDDFVQRAMRIK